VESGRVWKSLVEEVRSREGALTDKLTGDMQKLKYRASASLEARSFTFTCNNITLGEPFPFRHLFDFVLTWVAEGTVTT
jgi:hypothetical protein